MSIAAAFYSDNDSSSSAGEASPSVGAATSPPVASAGTASY